jgi:HAMP domain-containing protein
MWPGYDGVTRTISDLAADDSPVQLFISAVFMFGAVCDIVISHYAKALPIAGRLVILLIGIATIGLTVFTTPSQESFSVMHRIFAISSFVLLCVWPLFAMRRGEDAPPLLRPIAAVAGTLAIGLVCLWFLSLWGDPTSTITGLAERIGVAVQGLYPMIVLWHTYSWQRKRAK